MGIAGSLAVKRVFLVRDLRGPDPKVSAKLEGEIDSRDSATAFVSREEGNLSSSALRWFLVHLRASSTCNYQSHPVCC